MSFCLSNCISKFLYVAVRDFELAHHFGHPFNGIQYQGYLILFIGVQELFKWYRDSKL